MYCSNCGHDVGNEPFCEKCGSRTDSPTVSKFCRVCGTQLAEAYGKCPNCGADTYARQGVNNTSVYGRGRNAQGQQQGANNTSVYGRGRNVQGQQQIADKAKKPKWIIPAVIAAVVIIAGAAAWLIMSGTGIGGGNGDNNNVIAVNPEDVYEESEPIKIMTKSYNSVQASDDSPVMKELEEIIGSEISMEWTPSTDYDAAVTSVIGSGKYPHVMLVSNSNPAFIQAARHDMFWDISKYLNMPEKYPNLAMTKPAINHNISVDGKVYGIYRARTVGRAGVSIRRDWLDNLGEPIPETIDDLDRVMDRFTFDDPDKNGIADTYGMTVTTYLSGPINNLAVWMGAPNGWGDKNGKLEPAFMFDEYTDALDLMHEWYDKGYININMASLSSDRWNDDFLNGYSGIIIDVADRARRLARNIEESDPNAVVDVFGYVTRDAFTAPATLPTNGYDGFYVFPKATIKTTEDLEFILGVMDKLNSREAVTLMNYGIEGIHYTVDSSNFITKSDDAFLGVDYADLNQLSMGIIEYDDAPKTRYDTPVAEKVDQVYAENEMYAVFNPAEPYLSDTYVKKGAQLESIISEAQMNYITGKISKDEYEKQIDLWRKNGGDDVIREINDDYAKDASVGR